MIGNIRLLILTFGFLAIDLQACGKYVQSTHTILTHSSVMRVLQLSASNVYAENASRSSILSADSVISTTFGNNNETDRTHSKSNIERSATTTTNSTTNVTTATATSSHQQNSHSNCRSSSTNEEFNFDASLIDSSDGVLLKEHQNNFITVKKSGTEAVDSLQNVDSSNYSFFEDCVNEFANLESFKRISSLSEERTINRDENNSQRSGESSPSFEDIHLDNYALERELNRIIRGTSISEACEDDNSCNCKSLQESLKSYELIRDTSATRDQPKHDDNASINGDDDDYDDDQMDPHFNAESITRSSELSPDDSLMDDDDEEYLSSQASSCTSVSTPQRSHFPRGIINPNYPGFQHLAHTLSEHYISHQSTDPYDSDLSEYEMELSVDSFECDFLDIGSNSVGSNINHNNNNNINTVMVINNNSVENKLPDKTIEMDDTEDNFNEKQTPGTENGLDDDRQTAIPSINVTKSDSNLNSDEKESNLQTYLKLYDVTTQQQEENEQRKNLEIEIPHDDGNYGCPTPDILIKNYNSERYSRRIKPENRPDLLRNVSPNPPMKCRFEVNFEDEEKLLQRTTERDSPPNTLCTDSKSDMGRDDISLGLTPVDIVGDFGQEVEREFGLIVSGYNSRMDYINYPTGAFYLYDVGEAEKISDAILSNGRGNTPTSRYTTIVDHVDSHRCMPSETDASNLDIAHKNHTEVPSMENHISPEVSVDHYKSHDQLSENSNLRLNTQGTNNAGNEQNIVNNCTEDPNRTTDLKPKYQKPSYDERQLPPIGLDFNVKSRAWFDCPGSSNTRSTRKSYNADRNSKIMKNSKFTRGNSNNSSTNRYGSGPRRMGNNNKAKEVAIVSPIMKETEETQMENDEILNNKPVVPHCTRYSFASWAANLRRKNPKYSETDPSACFDVYNIETALPEIDLEAIETHLKRANEEERRRRNDREEIRRRLAMGAEDDYVSKLVTNNVRPGRKPSLQSRLQNGKNLQICFTNEVSSDTESHSSDSETCPKLSRMVARNRNEIPKFFSSIDNSDHPYKSNPLSVKCTNNNLKKSQGSNNASSISNEDNECDFFTRQARLQIEARMALSQAKDMAHMQMELDRQKQRLSPITGIIRESLEKVGVIMAPEKRRVSRQMLTDMNIAQLQVVVNDLHTQIEDLNDSLVHYLMERDELHMGQDSMLVDIEDISRFLSAKELEDDL